MTGFYAGFFLRLLETLHAYYLRQQTLCACQVVFRANNFENIAPRGNCFNQINVILQNRERKQTKSEFH